MALNIQNDEADRLAHVLSRMTGESLTDAVIEALRERIEREAGRRSGFQLRDDMDYIQARIAELRRLYDGADEEVAARPQESGLPA